MHTAAGRVGRRCTVILTVTLAARCLLARDAAQRLQLWLRVALAWEVKCDVGTARHKVRTHRSCKLDEPRVVVGAGPRRGREEQREDGDDAAVSVVCRRQVRASPV